MIGLAEQYPSWALGFLDETWWSRVARPALHAWSEEGQPLRLIEQEVPKSDPDPKALACYGLLVRGGLSDTAPMPEVWLRFVQGRPVSSATIQFLEWCCGKLERLGKRVWALIWDNARLSSESSGAGLDQEPQPHREAAGQGGPHRALLSAHQESLAEPD